MPELRIARKNDFIFRKYKIMINKEIFYLKRGEKKIMNLPSGTYEINVELDWAKAKKNIKLDNYEDIIIRTRIPNLFHIIFLVSLITLFCLSFLSYFSYFTNFIVVFLYFIPQLYYLVFKWDDYFIIEEKS
nr:hypothetical protein [uncultured Bacteroides sp.]